MDAASRRTLLDRYRAGADEVARVWATLDETQRDRRPEPGEWTAREIVHHLADSETRSAIRLRQLLAEDDPVIQPYDQDEYARRLPYDGPVEASLAQVAAVRAWSLALVEQLDDADLARAGTHPEHDEPYTVALWLQLYADHPWEHADQMRRAAGLTTPAR